MPKPVVTWIAKNGLRLRDSESDVPRREMHRITLILSEDRTAMPLRAHRFCYWLELLVRFEACSHSPFNCAVYPVFSWEEALIGVIPSCTVSINRERPLRHVTGISEAADW